MILCINGVPVRKGQEVVSFRGEKGILKDWRLPHKESIVWVGCIFSGKGKMVVRENIIPAL